jgi:hypothetical protein
MTDWCLSKIKFMASDSVLENLIERFKKVPPDSNSQKERYAFFSKLVPMPSEIEKLGESTDDYYDKYRLWIQFNWGCKYAEFLAFLDQREHEFASFTMVTGWTPPIIGLLKISELAGYSDLAIKIDYQLLGVIDQSYEITEPYGYYLIKNGIVKHFSMKKFSSKNSERSFKNIKPSLLYVWTREEYTTDLMLSYRSYGFPIEEYIDYLGLNEFSDGFRKIYPS